MNTGERWKNLRFVLVAIGFATAAESLAVLRIELEHRREILDRLIRLVALQISLGSALQGIHVLCVELQRRVEIDNSRLVVPEARVDESPGNPGFGLVRIAPQDARVEVIGKLDKPGKMCFVGNDLYLAGTEQMRRLKDITKQ